MRWCGRDLRRLDHLRCPVKKSFHAVGRLRRPAREQDPKSPFCIHLRTWALFTTAGFAQMAERAGEAAELDFKALPHMLRHACGFALANKGKCNSTSVSLVLSRSRHRSMFFRGVRKTKADPVPISPQGRDGATVRIACASVSPRCDRPPMRCRGPRSRQRPIRP